MFTTMETNERRTADRDPRGAGEERFEKFRATELPFVNPFYEKGSLLFIKGPRSLLLGRLVWFFSPVYEDLGSVYIRDALRETRGFRANFERFYGSI